LLGSTLHSRDTTVSRVAFFKGVVCEKTKFQMVLRFSESIFFCLVPGNSVFRPTDIVQGVEMCRNSVDWSALVRSVSSSSSSKPRNWLRTVSRICIKSRVKVYTFVGHRRNTPIERIILVVAVVTRTVLHTVIAYFLNFIQEFWKLVSFRYNLPESCAYRVPSFPLIFVHSRSGEEFHSGNMEIRRVLGTKPGPE
jgi:hypothetical protein